MTPADKFIQTLANAINFFNIWWLVKFLFLTGLLIYIAFAIIIIRQVGLMAKTVDGGFGRSLRFVAFVHLLAALLTFLLAVVIL